MKAQSSMEFFTLVGLAFLAVIIFVGASAGEIKEFTDQKNFFLIKDVTLTLQKEASIAASVEDGYEREFTLPEKLESRVDYFINTESLLFRPLVFLCIEIASELSPLF